MNLKNYTNEDLTNLAVQLEDNILSSNHESSETLFFILMQQKVLLEAEIRKRGLEYSALVRST